MQRRLVFGTLFAIVALIGCSNDPTQPSSAPLEGSYTATAFTVVTPDTVFDLLQQGVSLRLTLNPDGTTSGTQVVSTTVTDLTGRWDTTAATLRLHLPTPGLLTQTVFVIGPDRLQGDPLIGSFKFHLTFAKDAGSAP